MKNNDSDNFNFDSFSNLDWYKTVNSNLLDLADLNSSNKIIDGFVESAKKISIFRKIY